MSRQPFASIKKPHLPPNTTGLNLSPRAARAIKGIQELSESDDGLCALDYTIFSQYLALASQEVFAIQVSLMGKELSQRPTLPSGLRGTFEPARPGEIEYQKDTILDFMTFSYSLRH